MNVNRALFWDLQGTLGGDPVASIELFEPYSFSKEALKLAKANGFYNIVITNQSRISKGTLSTEIYEREMTRIKKYFNEDEVLLDDIYCCPHQSSDKCTCKKPQPGLIKESVAKYNLDIKECFVIGDMGKNEIVMAHNAGCKGILVLTGGGKGSLGEFRNTWAEYKADMIAENALEAVKRIIIFNGVKKVNEYIVRKFQVEDAEEVSALIAKTLRTVNIKDYSEEYIEKDVKMLSSENLIERASWTHFYVICDNDVIVGCGAIGPYWGKKDESSLFTIFVQPEYQGKGIGRMIIETLERDEFFLRAKRVEIPASITACEFYKKMGYTYKNGIDVVDEEQLYRLEKVREI